MRFKTLKLRNLCVLSVLRNLWEMESNIVIDMALKISILNADTAVLSPFGSATATPTTVIHATEEQAVTKRKHVQVITKRKDAPLKLIILQVVKNLHWVVDCAGVQALSTKIFESIT